MHRRAFIGAIGSALALAALATPALASAEIIGGADVQGNSTVGRYTLHIWSGELNGWCKVGILSEGNMVITEAVDELPPMGVYGVRYEAPTQPVWEKGMPFAAMQPGNGAGSIVGDKAQSVGKPGDLKGGGGAGGVSQGKPTPRAIDARKGAWFDGLFGRPYRPHPS